MTKIASLHWGLPSGPAAKNAPASAADAGSIPAWELSSHVPWGS